MSSLASPSGFTVEQRASQSRGTSEDAIYRMIAAAIAKVRPVETLVDVGCGTGNLLPYVRKQVVRYVGADVVRYDKFPAGLEFVNVDLDSGRSGLPDEVAGRGPSPQRRSNTSRTRVRSFASSRAWPSRAA